MAGHGLVYNIGEHVQGSAGPLEIFLVAGVIILGIPSKFAALLISLAANVGFLILAHRLISRISGGNTSPLIILPLAVAPSIAVISVSGMETMLFICLQTMVFINYVSSRLRRLGLSAGVRIKTRIDGVLVVL